MSKESLLDMLARLNQGEELESVREDFVKVFEHVPVQTIIDAEQELVDSGTPLTEMNKLCDLHSSLMHGHTESEVCGGCTYPWLIRLLQAENQALLERIEKAKNARSYEELKAVLSDLTALKKHYQKKEELIMPFLYLKGKTGPSQVMWGVDDEILHSLVILNRTLTPETWEENKPEIASVLKRMEEMAYKEENIFFPMAQDTLSKEEWLQSYGDEDQYGIAWIDWTETWPEGEAYRKEHAWVPEDLEIQLPTGKVSLQQLETMLNMLPLDITYIDENDNLIFFTNEGKVFGRPKSALGRDVNLCHPPRIVPLVKSMLADFKAGKRNRVERWIPRPDKPVKVVYQAVYDENGTYKGTVETVQTFETEKDILVRLAANQARKTE